MARAKKFTDSLNAAFKALRNKMRGVKPDQPPPKGSSPQRHNHRVESHGATKTTATRPRRFPATPLTLDGSFMLHQNVPVRWTAWRALGARIENMC